MKIKVEFKLDNASFKHDDETLDFMQVSEALYHVSQQVEMGDIAGVIVDDGGNTVGSWLISGKGLK